MKHFVITGLLLLQLLPAWPQGTAEQLESLAAATEGAPEDDSYQQRLEYLSKHPLNINTVTAEDLQALQLFNPMQVLSFIIYRQQFGAFIDRYELQAVPLWDVALVRKAWPFLTLESGPEGGVLQRLKGGGHTIIGRLSRVLQQQKGFDRALPNHYLGGRDRFFFRYKYQKGQLLQYGLTADKDAGEPFLKRGRGFDFYSVHFFARRLGRVKALALGDFTVNMGQGLVQWQSLAFKKSAEVMSVTRQSPVLVPYQSAGEFYFNRGAGATVQWGRVETTLFGGYRRLTAHRATDPATGAAVVTGFGTSGLHRTEGERADKHSMGQASLGGTVTYGQGALKISGNAVQHYFSRPLLKRNAPENLYAIRGRRWFNGSVDYQFTHRNMHCFGEAAVDARGHLAWLQGLLVSADPRVDLSFLYRRLAPAYQALYGDAFTENAQPGNERGLYAGLTFRPAPGWRLDAFADAYRFPWIGYRRAAPGGGREVLLQLTYQPARTVEIQARYRHDEKEMNAVHNNPGMAAVIGTPRQNVRFHFSQMIHTVLKFSQRLEMTWYDKGGKSKEEGFLGYIECFYKPVPALSTNLRLQYFETDSYDSRLYAYETDVLYSYSIPAFSQKGFRVYVNVSGDVSKKVSCWFRWAHTVYAGRGPIGTGGEEISGKRRSEIKFQLRLSL